MPEEKKSSSEPMGRKIKRNRARYRAYSRLADKYSADFADFYSEEKRKVGL